MCGKLKECLDNPDINHIKDHHREHHAKKKLARGYVVAGHSQGGQTAWFAAAVSADYAPKEKILGAIAFSSAVGWDKLFERIEGQVYV